MIALSLAMPLLSIVEISAIGDKIFHNETSGKEEHLVFWNPKEQFPSMGIGHFVWLPPSLNTTIPIQDIFSEFLIFCEDRRVDLPFWLRANKTCPWHSREDFEAANWEDIKNVREFLLFHQGIQAEFILAKFMQELPVIVHALAEEQAVEYCTLLLNTSRGCFALVDYNNFKGSGLEQASSAYNGQRWGLKQVLEKALAKTFWKADPLKAFILSAKETLADRVANAPLDKQAIERSYIDGWYNRLDRY